MVVVVVVAATPNYLRQASPDRGKYFVYIFEEKLEPHVILPGCAAPGERPDCVDNVVDAYRLAVFNPL